VFRILNVEHSEKTMQGLGYFCR